MSADNAIFVMEWFCEWYVWHGSLSADYYEPASFEDFFGTEEEAVKFAHEYVDKLGYVEGGVIFIRKEDEEKALINTIDSLTERLKHLQKHGTQYKWN